jgi:hypothetical protein
VIDPDDAFRQIDTHLSCPNQSWLLGAGISLMSGIPLMLTLTERIYTLLAKDPSFALLKAIKDDLPDDAHIEHVLSQLADYIAIAERSKSKELIVGGKPVQKDDLKTAHQSVLKQISNIVRWGYVKGTPDKKTPDKEGTMENPIVVVDHHLEFVKALFVVRQAGVHERRKAVKLFTTNYDTLIEDALALSGIPYYDGFSGGALAFWNHPFGTLEPDSEHRACVVKLHGSIDWRINAEGTVRRVRLGDGYPKDYSQVLIYPQASKYVATQRDPFASQFDRLRKALHATSDNILGVCGYSFGDEHVNAEIQLAMQLSESKTTILAFVQEIGGKLPPVLETWLKSNWGERVFVASDKALYQGDKVLAEPDSGKSFGWWTFAGLTKFLQDASKP